MKTEQTQVDGIIYVFAKAKTPFQIQNLKPGELPFEYELKTYDYGDENCVRVHSFPISGIVPAGIDLTMAAMGNLRDKIDALNKEHAAAIKDLEDRIRSLALIEYKPNDEAV